MRSSAFLCKPSRLTWLSRSFLVLSVISSLILITSQLHHLTAYWLSQFYLNLLVCCISHLPQLVCLSHVTSMCPSYDISYIWFTRVIAYLSKMRSDFIDGCVYMSLGILGDAKCEEKKSFIIFFTEPNSIL